MLLRDPLTLNRFLKLGITKGPQVGQSSLTSIHSKETIDSPKVILVVILIVISIVSLIGSPIGSPLVISIVSLIVISIVISIVRSQRKSTMILIVISLVRPIVSSTVRPIVSSTVSSIVISRVIFIVISIVSPKVGRARLELKSGAGNWKGRHLAKDHFG